MKKGNERGFANASLSLAKKLRCPVRYLFNRKPLERKLTWTNALKDGANDKKKLKGRNIDLGMVLLSNSGWWK